MSLAVALPTAVAGAIAFGGSTAVQHQAAQNGPLSKLIRNPRWWLSIGGDSVGLALQLVALATGPVVLVQPLFILSLPVALPIRTRLGGPPVTRADYAACAVLVAGLAGFFALAGNPGSGVPPTVIETFLLVVAPLVVGLALVAGARVLGLTGRAVVISSVAGVYFGVEAVLINAASTEWIQHGWSVFLHVRGSTTFVGAAAIGLTGFWLAQLAFQAGSLGASFPAMLVLDPLTAVLLGAGLLHEHLGLMTLRGVGYLVALALIVAATVRLAAPAVGAAPIVENAGR